MKFFVQPRKWWDEKPPQAEIPLLETPVKYVFFTYTKGNYCYSIKFCHTEISMLKERQMKRPAYDIIYNFLIGGGGRVYEGRGWKFSPKLAYKFKDVSRNSILIAYMGIFKGTRPPKPMCNAGDWLVKHGVSRGLIDPRFLECRVAHCGSNILS